jgi:hypothetical protein
MTVTVADLCVIATSSTIGLDGVPQPGDISLQLAVSVLMIRSQPCTITVLRKHQTNHSVESTVL